MREQGTVQTAAIGGRPRNEPMQGAGGTEGVGMLAFDNIQELAMLIIQGAERLHGIEYAKKLNDTTNVSKIYKATRLRQRSTNMGDSDMMGFGSVNSLNDQRQGDDTNTPHRFIYNAADCRLLYTPASYHDPVVLWKMAIDAKWGKGKCVPGSAGHKATIGTINNRPGFGSKGRKSQQSGADSTVFQPTGASSPVAVPRAMLVLVSVAALGFVM